MKVKIISEVSHKTTDENEISIAINKIGEYFIRSVEEYIAVINELIYKQNEGCNVLWFYRGEREDNWHFEPSVFRKNFSKWEKRFFEEAHTRMPQEFESLTNIDRLAKMQHYRWPTRLLDFSTNPLYALYFACEDIILKKQNHLTHDKSGRVYVISRKFRSENKEKDVILSYNSDRAMLLGCLAKLSENEQGLVKEFTEALYDYNSKNKTEEVISRKTLGLKKTGEKNENKKALIFELLTKDKVKNAQSAFDRFYGEARKERATFDDFGTNPEDLLKSFIFLPQKHKMKNERLRDQGGAFCIFGLGSVRDENNIRKECKSILIPFECKKTIIQQLDFLGINQSTVYADLEHAGNYVKDYIAGL